EEVEDLVLVDHHVVGEGHPLGAVHQILQMVDQLGDAAMVPFRGLGLLGHRTILAQLHFPQLRSVSRSAIRRATDGLTAKLTSPPKRATSLTSDELRKTLAKLVIRNTVVTLGASVRLKSACWNSLSQSLPAGSAVT